MFDPRDLSSDPRTRPEARPRRDHAKEREDRERNGHRREYDPRNTKRQTFQDRTDRAIADVGMYRNVAYRDVADAHFEGHPYAARRAVDQMVRAGHVREHNAEGPQGGSYKVLTLTERGVERAERVARDQGDALRKKGRQVRVIGIGVENATVDRTARVLEAWAAAEPGTPDQGLTAKQEIKAIRDAMKQNDLAYLEQYGGFGKAMKRVAALYKLPEAKLTEGVSIDDYSTWRAVRFAERDEIG